MFYLRVIKNVIYLYNNLKQIEIMKVNINGTWYDAEKDVIQIELTQSDKDNIAKMHNDKFNYISFPNDLGWEKAEKILNNN